MVRTSPQDLISFQNLVSTIPCVLIWSGGPAQRVSKNFGLQNEEIPENIALKNNEMTASNLIHNVVHSTETVVDHYKTNKNGILKEVLQDSSEQVPEDSLEEEVVLQKLPIEESVPVEEEVLLEQAMEELPSTEQSPLEESKLIEEENSDNEEFEDVPSTDLPPVEK